MRWMKRKDNASPNGYWDTLSDIMTNLLLVLLLVIVLLVFYVVQAPKQNNQEKHPESIPQSQIVDDGVKQQYVEREAGHTVVKVDVPYMLPGMEDEEYGRGEQTGDFLYRDGGFDELQFDGHAGAAVRVIVEDAETHNAILEEGITFSLYSAEGRLRKLYTYYPMQTGWIQYQTDKTGSFLMPEKLPLASYVLHELTAPKGYAFAEDKAFTLEKPQTWQDPYVLHVLLESVRSTIQVEAIDGVSGAPVAGGTFDIIAEEDISTKDGTIHYPKGSIVDQIVCDDDGKGQSIKLFLGKYIIQQSTAPEYYAVAKQNYPVAIFEGENGVESVVQQILCEKTQFNLNAFDELYNDIAISNAEFVLYNSEEDKPIQLTTDEKGCIHIDNLIKEASYTLVQSSAPTGYYLNDKEIVFYVDNNGWIDDYPTYSTELTNRTLRISVLIQDAVFHNSVAGSRVTLYNEQNEPVNAWYSVDTATMVQGMPYGQYRLEITGSGTATQSLQIQDTAEVQSVLCSIWTMGNKIMVGGSGCGIVSIGLVVGYLIKRKRKRK